MSAIISIEKNGSVITILTDEKSKPFSYDCKDNLLYSYTGKAIKNMSPILSRCMSHENRGIQLLKECICLATRGDYRGIRRIEQFIPYLDLIRTGWTALPEKCPKGYIQFVKENNVNICEQSFEDFNRMQATKNYCKEDKDFYELLLIRFNTSSTIMRVFLELTPIQRKKVRKIFKVSTKEFRWALDDDFYNFLMGITGNRYNYKSVENWVDYVDENRNFEYNLKLIDDIVNKDRNKKILAFESKIKEIENLSNETFTIIVPSSMSDFTDEGKMQNNCVGYFYHDSIAKNASLIYFIRKSNNPKHSYITNRFDVRSGETVETRMVNNEPNTDKASQLLIDKIDEMIKNILKEKKGA